MIKIRLIEEPNELEAVADLQRLCWPGDETEIIPVHLLRSVVHNGGFVIGAYREANLVGFVFGYPGIHQTSEGIQLYHSSHMAGVHPEIRDAGLGYRLKRAQWQMVRRQGVDLIVWTYDPLQSRNANFNISKLGVVCNNYLPNYYGEMRDGINIGVPSDRFEVNWWVNTNRVKSRLGKKPPPKLDLAHYLNAGAVFANASQINADGLITPVPSASTGSKNPWRLIEIPSDILALKAADPALAVQWYLHIRDLFSNYFAKGFLVTDFVYLSGSRPRSFYVLSYGKATL
jgi:predicted GNAT superfamily acetyltransferase